MTTPSDPSRPGAPTVREIAALTARLRDISARGRDVDPAERAQFMADKDALIARIAEPDDIDEATGRGGPEMPEWMRHQARETEAAIAAGTLPDVYPDDRAALAERIAALRAERDEDAPGTSGEREPLDEVERAFDELCERHPLPGDGPGEWVADRNGYHWHDYDEVIDDDTPISAEIATANPDVWDGAQDELDAIAEYHRTAFLPREGSRAWTEQDQQHHQVFGAALDRSGCASATETEQERRELLVRWHAEDHADAPDDASVRFTCGGYETDLGRD